MHDTNTPLVMWCILSCWSRDENLYSIWCGEYIWRFKSIHNHHHQSQIEWIAKNFPIKLVGFTCAYHLLAGVEGDDGVKFHFWGGELLWETDICEVIGIDDLSAQLSSMVHTILTHNNNRDRQERSSQRLDNLCCCCCCCCCSYVQIETRVVKTDLMLCYFG